MYEFLLSMWIARRIDDEYLKKATALNRITETEKNLILATPQKKIEELSK